MKILKPFFDIFRFLYDDFKSDITTIIEIFRRLSKGEQIFNTEKIKEEFRGYSVYQFLQDNWLFFLMLTFAFISGWFIASQQYQDKCNTWIIDNIFENEKCYCPGMLESITSRNETIITLDYDLDFNTGGS